MTIESELKAILDAPELHSLLASASHAKARDLVERDLVRRRGEIELELSSATAKLDEVLAKIQAANARIRHRLHTGRHGTRFAVSLWVLGLGVLAALISIVLGWSPGRQMLASWQSPFTSGWIAAVVWVVYYAAVALAAFEADFYLRRLPARRLQANSEENLRGLQSAVTDAKTARRKQLVAIVRDHVTEILNTSRGPVFGASMRVQSEAAPSTRERITLAIGLSEVTNDDNMVATGVQQRLVQQITRLPGASIGISGPRGVGKSTLLAALCAANPTIRGRTAIAISTSAPVEYDGRDFLLHVFSSLCRQVLRTEGREETIEEESAALMEARRWQRASLLESLLPIARLLAVAGIILVAIAFTFATVQSLVQADRAAPAGGEGQPAVEAPATKSSPTPASPRASPEPRPPSSSSQSPEATDKVAAAFDPSAQPSAATSPFAALVLAPAPLFTLGIVAFVLGVTIAVAMVPYRRLAFVAEQKRKYQYDREHPKLVQRCLDELSNIRFQRSFTSGWSGSLKIPAGLEMGSTAGLTLAQRPESLPELVERFRAFVRDVARTYNNVVIIGIDELDKLKSAQQAEAFLNGVKSVFGILGCFYLISVSEHALAAFERRGIGFRDAFDSALDDIVQLDFLDLDQSRVLLNRRILRLPDPFLQLCHMLSGGLPRDLIRHARMLLDCAAEAPSGSLSLRNAVAQMTTRDLTARLRATSIAMRTVREVTETSELLVQVAALPTTANIKTARAALAPFRAHVGGLTRLRDSEEGRVLLRLAEELAVYYEMMILLRQVAGLLSTKKGWERTTELGFANQVAGVRQALEVSVPLAELRLAELRKLIADGASSIDRIVNPHLHRRKP